MSINKGHVRSKSTGFERLQQIQLDTDEYESKEPPKKDSLPNILPELSKIIRKLLPNELLLNVHVRNVEYIEHGCERFSGTLYMTIFRLVFAPDNETEINNLILSGNKYIGEYDIPLTSIYTINVAPVDSSRSGRRAFRSDGQLQLETRGFTILTRDFRSITFTKSSMKKCNSSTSKPEISSTKMETYIDALRVHTRFQDKEQLYPHIATQRPTLNKLISKSEDNCAFLISDYQSIDDELADFSSSNEERIKSYLTCQDWYSELREANENRWIVDQNKFGRKMIARDEGPFIYLPSTDGEDSLKDMVWHWTHISETETNLYSQQCKKPVQYMLVTAPKTCEVTVSADPLRRSTTESSLVYSYVYVSDQQFQRFNLVKFPCSLKGLETSFEKLVEMCVTIEEDDEKWLTKLQACKWLRYVSKALRGAASLAKLLDYNNIQFVGNEIDNSCLMSSLIQILLRPKCRTIKGFCELIVREWVIRGYPFRERFGQAISNSDKNPAQESPIFLLFLDCVHQLINQNSTSFEFTEYFLIEIYRSVCYCYHHTFAFNSVIERLNAINNYPKNIIILSSFDFSLYLYPETCHLLKNQASIFVSRKFTPPPPPSRTRSATTRKQPANMTQVHELLKGSIGSPRLPNRPSYRLETPKSDVPPLSQPPSPTTEKPTLNPELFEYDNIEAPQKFSSDLYVDWRAFNLVLWSKCYCRYDENYLPTSSEQELLSEIGSLEYRIQKKPPEETTTDTFHAINYANSWHPQIFETRV